MKLLKKIFFPGVPYPIAIVWHLFLFGTLFAICSLVFTNNGKNGASNATWQGALFGLVVGFIVWLIVRDKPQPPASRGSTYYA